MSGLRLFNLLYLTWMEFSNNLVKKKKKNWMALAKNCKILPSFGIFLQIFNFFHNFKLKNLYPASTVKLRDNFDAFDRKREKN